MAKSMNTGDACKSKASIGRPKAARIKDHWISFRVTSEEHYHLLDKAHRSDMGPGEYARTRSLRGIARAKKGARGPAELFGEQTRAIYHEIRKQGVNLNQIAHHCNRHQLAPPREVAELLEKLKVLWDRIVL